MASRGTPFFDPRTKGSYPAALLGTLPVLPVIASVLLLLNWDLTVDVDGFTLLPLEITIPLAVLIWFLISGAYFLLGSTTPAKANIGIYGELRQPLAKLFARFDEVTSDQVDSLHRQAIRELQSYTRTIERDLSSGGIGWVNGTSYVSLSKVIHRADECSIILDSVGSVLSGALHDDLRLRNARMENREELLAQLWEALYLLAPDLKTVHAVNPELNHYERRRSSRNQTEGVSIVDTKDKSAINSPFSNDATIIPRAMLVKVNRAINEFRDDQWDGLVRARNRLTLAIGLAGSITYLSLATAQLQEARQLIELRSVSETGRFIVMGSVTLYVVGAVVGLFSRLYQESAIDTAGEDYGLSHARLFLTPLLSGIAAVGGVFLFTMLTIQTAAAVVAGEASSLAGQGLFGIERFLITPYSFVIAAIFGLTPSLLISSLQQQTTRFNAALRSTEGSEHR